MVWMSLAIGAALSLRAIEPARFLYWRDFSTLWTIYGVTGTWAALSLVAYLGIAASRAALGADAWLGTDLAAALIAQASARRMRSSERGGTLVLGILPDFFRWVEAFVQQRVTSWAESLDDSRLVSAAARLDGKLKGIGGPATLAKRVEWRQAAADRLLAGPDMRDEARLDLVRLITAGYTTYLLRKMR